MDWFHGDGPQTKQRLKTTLAFLLTFPASDLFHFRTYARSRGTVTSESPPFTKNKAVLSESEHGFAFDEWGGYHQPDSWFIRRWINRSAIVNRLQCTAQNGSSTAPKLR